MSRRIYDNWERLVAATLKKEQIWQLCHASSTEPSGTGSSGSSDLAPEETVVNGSGPSLLPLSPTRTVDFDISSEELVSIHREENILLLQQNGGVKGLAEKLKCNLEKGISGDETDLINRTMAFGSNTYPRKKGRSFWMFVWDACQSTILIILMVAAAASFAVGIKTEGIKKGWHDGGGIVLVVLIAIIFVAVMDYKLSLEIQNWNKEANWYEEEQNIQIEVIRSGRRIKVSIFEIVVGDVVALKIGDQVPADGLVISSHSLSIDESSTPGESGIVYKDSITSPSLMSGCKVADGYGTMLVTGVGINTEWGSLMAAISWDSGDETPLQKRLNEVATSIGVVEIGLAVLILVVLVIRYFSGHTKNPDGIVQFIAGKSKVGGAVDGFIKAIIDAVTIVVLVPEVLPLVAPLTVVYSMREMMADMALVRRISACEAMGSATTICCDGTGILTLNQMTVVEAYACGMKIHPPDNKSLLPPSVFSLLIEGIAQNTTGSVFVPQDGGAIEVSGSLTEKAILQWGISLGMDFHAVRSESVKIHASPFNSEKKQGGVALKLSDSEVRGHWKGAAEIVLASCTGYIDVNDRLVPMDEDKLSFFKKAIEDMALGSLHCIAIAYRPYEIDKVPSSDEELENWQLPETDLILLAVVGIKNPCQPNARHAVQVCTDAGIKIFCEKGLLHWLCHCLHIAVLKGVTLTYWICYKETY